MEDLVQVLTKFHREIVLPDVERIVGTAVGDLRDEMHTLLDALVHEVRELRTEYYMVVAGLKRIEERLDRVEARLDRSDERLDKLALRSELVELKGRMDGLQEQVRTLEARLDR